MMPPIQAQPITASTSPQALGVGPTFSTYLELTKPRLSTLSVLTAAAGFFTAPAFEITATFFWMLSGTAACAGGVAALNQWMEADTDARMNRTASRPIPSGRIAAGSAFVLGWALCIAGLAALFVRVNGLSAFFALATIVCYLALYTPAKRRSRFSTEIGAVAGALPPLIGWAANDHHTTALGWILFGVLFLWQIPHFMAIAWIYRHDYEAVAFPMLAVRDDTGARVAKYSLVCAVALVGVSLLPFFYSNATMLYLIFTLLLGAWFVVRAARFAEAYHFVRQVNPTPREHAARRLFFASIIWLPLQLTALALACS